MRPAFLLCICLFSAIVALTEAQEELNVDSPAVTLVKDWRKKTQPEEDSTQPTSEKDDVDTSASTTASSTEEEPIEPETIPAEQGELTNSTTPQVPRLADDTPTPTPVPFDAVAHQKQLAETIAKMDEEEQLKSNCNGTRSPSEKETYPELSPGGPQQPVPEGDVIPPKIPKAPITVAHSDLKCGQFETCDTCLRFDNQAHGSGCGWCADTKTCMPGTTQGPQGDPLEFNCTHWDFGFCSGEPCSALKSCFQCTSDPFCGWCADHALCMEGTQEGPLFEWCEHWTPYTGIAGDRCGLVRGVAITPTPEPNVMDYPAAA